MSAFREAVLSVAPDRLEAFSMEVKKNISDKSRKSGKRNQSSSSQSKNSNSHKRKKRAKRSDEKSLKSKDKVETKSRDKKSGKVRKQSSSTCDQSPSGKQSSKEKKRKPEKEKEDSDFDKTDLDLSIPMYPLCSLVKDRSSLLETIFTIIKGPKLTSMLPDILKLMPLEEIKQLCLEQLEVMSSKRILHILSGKEMHSSSGTDSSDNEQAGRRNKTQDLAASHTQQERSLQTNFVDSTTDEPSSSTKSMLFPSALSTAQHKSEIPVKEVTNDNTEQNTVSTSTEPNFIYSAEQGQGDESRDEDSDPEEGEVRSCSDEDEDIEKPVKEEHQDIEEEVMVEEELLVEDDNQAIEQASPPMLGTKRKRKVVVKDKRTKIVKMNADGNPNETECDEEDKPPAVTESTAVPDGNQPEPVTEEPTQEADPYAGKTQLEILELEMRARAIRSLMRAAQANKLKQADK